jgi:tRNA (cmo5U34)-methyltransferase
MGQFHFDPATYRDLMAAEVPAFERLQDEVADASRTAPARTILELGTGTGETARRVLAAHPDARLVGVDASERMLAVAREALPEADLRVGRLEEPLPPGPFDLVVSALCVHHLDGPGKADLFARVADVLAPGGRVVVGDVVVPLHEADVVTPIDTHVPDGTGTGGVVDMPSTAVEQLAWLAAAGLEPSLTWAHRDLAVLVGYAAPPRTAT